MGIQKDNESGAKVVAAKVKSRNVKSPPNHAETRVHACYEQPMKLVANGNYAAAIDLLRTAGKEPILRNALGVCLMRQGRAAEAVTVFRSLVLEPSGIWMRSDVPLLYQTNFATAILLIGQPDGCLELLTQSKDRRCRMAMRLRDSIRRWEKSLSWWQWINWKSGSIAPTPCVVEIDFPAGEFDAETLLNDPSGTDPCKPSLTTAA